MAWGHVYPGRAKAAYNGEAAVFLRCATTFLKWTKLAILRRTYLSSVHLPYFQDSIVAPIAHNLADELSFRIYDHLSAHVKHAIPSAKSREHAVLCWSEALAKLIKRALTLKCELSSAREEYKLQWCLPGTKYDTKLMESTHGPGEEVLTPVFPGIVVKRDGLTKPVCEARVRLK